MSPSPPLPQLPAGVRIHARVHGQGLTAMAMRCVAVLQPQRLSKGGRLRRGCDGDAVPEDAAAGAGAGTRHGGNPQPTLPARGVGPAKTEWGAFTFFPSLLLHLFGY